MTERSPITDRQRRNWTLAITNLIKVAGIVVVLFEIFGKTTPSALSMGVAAFMMAGAQLSEDVIIALATKFFALTPGPTEEPPEDSSKPQNSGSLRGTHKK